MKVIGVKFRTAGKIYFFDPIGLEINRGDHVIVETARGIEYGTVVSGVHEVEEDKIIQPLKPVLRIATQIDDEQEKTNKEKEKEAYKICLEKIRKHELDMKLIDAEYTFDNNKVLFYFTADGRIDFRELVKDLASVFKTRIELRQIGVRDETKIVGGIGICGRPLCCHSYLSDFVPVSIKMAKEQNLSLNPTKISGVCGRLMCCLKNEEETYEELNRRLPGIGDTVTTQDGLQGEVQSVNVLRQLVKVIINVEDEKEIREYAVDALSFRKKHNKRENQELSKEELKELERLEKEEIQEEEELLQERRTNKKKQEPQERRFDKGASANRFHKPGKDSEKAAATNNRAAQEGAEPRFGKDSEKAAATNNRTAQEGAEPRFGKDSEGTDGRYGRRQDKFKNRRYDKRNNGQTEKTPFSGEQTAATAQEMTAGVVSDKKYVENKAPEGQDNRYSRKNENKGERNRSPRYEKKGENRYDSRPYRRYDKKSEGKEGNGEELSAELTQEVVQQDAHYERRNGGRSDGQTGRRYERRNDGRYHKNRYGRKDTRKPENNES